VPPTLPTGPGRLFWTVAYTRPGHAANTTDGLSSFRVLPVAAAGDSGRPRKAWDLLWRAALGGVLLVGLLAFRSLRTRIAERLRGGRADGDDGVPDTVHVGSVAGIGLISVALDPADATPVRDIRIVVRRPPLTLQIPEELS
jgi:hypothetical protein